MKVLVCNAGSTSLKFKLYEMPACTVLATGKVERVGSCDDAIFGYCNTVTGYRVDAGISPTTPWASTSFCLS